MNRRRRRELGLLSITICELRWGLNRTGRDVSRTSGWRLLPLFSGTQRDLVKRFFILFKRYPAFFKRYPVFFQPGVSAVTSVGISPLEPALLALGRRPAAVDGDNRAIHKFGFFRT